MKKRFLAIGSIAVLGLALSACSSGSGASPSGGSTGDAGGAGGGKPYIALISKGFQHQFWQAVKQGADEAAKEFNVEVSFEGPDSETQVEQQLQQLTTALNKNPKAIGFAALDSEAAAPKMEEAKQKGIPVIAFDSGVDSDVPMCTVSTDNKAAAAEAAKHMVEAIGGSGEVALVVHDQTSVTGKDRRDGFTDYMKANAPNVKIVDIQYADGDQLKSAEAAKAIIQAHPNLKGIYGSNEGSAIGVVNGVKELNMGGKITVIGFDSGQGQIDAINDGTELGAVSQNPVQIGYQTVKAAVDAINGKDVPKTIDSGFVWYDKANINDPDVQKVLYK